jgi:hypothetical protein
MQRDDYESFLTVRDRLAYSDRVASHIRIRNVPEREYDRSLMVFTQPDYKPHRWRTTLLAWSLSALSALLNLVGDKFLPRFEGTILIFHILGFFASLTPLVYMRIINRQQRCLPTLLTRANGLHRHCRSLLV